jgi:CDP-diacylglycerol--inositol 3-phosphatidyltransferase
LIHFYKSFQKGGKGNKAEKIMAANDMEKSFRELTKTENVFLFVPNIIGYARIFLALLSFWVMPTNYVLASWCYILSGLLDAVDGHAARFLGQSSKFGAMLDMLTDRCATMCLLTTLSTFYPSFMFFFQLSMTIDIACHWIHLHTSLMDGKTSHKFVDPTGNWFMKMYYTDRRVLFCMCAGNELFYAMLYLLNFTTGPFYMFVPLAILTFPVALAKTGIALLQGYLAALNLASIDVRERAVGMEKDLTPAARKLE